MVHPHGAKDAAAAAAITGIGLVTPLGVGVEPSWRGIMAGRSAIGPLSALESAASDPSAADRRGGEVAGVALASIDKDRREVDLIDRALDEAIRSAGLDVARNGLAPDRIAVLTATTLAGMRRAAAYHRGFDERVLETFLAGEISRHAAARLGATGLVTTITAACASGLSVAIHGRALLATGAADVVVAIAYDPISEYAYGGFGSLRLIASGDLRPFQRGRDGMRLGEGCAVLVLERADDARRRGREPMATIVGAGESSDAFHLTRPHPDGEGLSRAIRTAMEDAQIDSKDLAMLSLHATGTPANDEAERSALHAVLRDRLGAIPAVAVKAACGHSLGAAGAVELALSAIALRERTIPPTAGFDRAAMEFDDVCLAAEARPMSRGGCTMGISLGFGGSNAVVILQPPTLSSATPRAAPNPDPVGAPETEPPGRAHRRLDRGEASLATAAEPMAITGVGFHGAGSVADAAALCARWRTYDGVESIEPSGPIDEEALDARAGGRRVRRMSVYARLALAATREAIEQSMLSADALADAAVLVASAHGACEYTERYYEQLVAEGLDAANPLWFAEGVPNVASAQVSMALGIRGAAQSVVGSRTAALDALHLARIRSRFGTGVESGRECGAGWSRVVVAAAEERSDLLDRAYRSLARATITSSHAAAAVMLEPVSVAGDRALALIEASVARQASDLTIAGIRDAVAEVVESLGEVDGIVSSCNGSWIGVAELKGIAMAIRGRIVPVSAMSGALREMHAAGPLAALVGAVLSGSLPTAPRNVPRVHGIAWATAPVVARRIAIVATAYDGSVRAVRVATRISRD